MPTVHIVGTATGGTITLSHTIVRCANVAQGCYFTSINATGAAVNSTSLIDFTASATAVIPPGVTDAVAAANCGSSGTFAVRLTHIVSSSNATVTITTA